MTTSVDMKRLVLAPNFPVAGGHGSSLSIKTISTSNDKYACIFQTPANVTITHLGLSYAAKNGVPVQHRISLQGVNSSGQPDGVIASSALFTPPNDASWNGTWQWIELDDPVGGFYRGDFVCVVVEPVGSPDGSNHSQFQYGISSYVARQAFPYALTRSGGSWFKDFTSLPIFGFKDDTGAPYGYPIGNIVSTTLSVNGQRVAMKFKLPNICESFTLVGARILGGQSTAGTIRISLWNNSGTLLQSVDIDSDWAGTINDWTIQESYFEEEDLVTLFPNQYYYVGFERVDVAVDIITYQTTEEANTTAFPGGPEFFLSTYSGGVWTDDRTSRPAVELVLEQWDQGAASNTTSDAGKLRIGSTATAIILYPTISSSGRLTIGGTSSVNFASATYPASGRCVIGSTATVLERFTYVASGNVVIYGASITPYTASGGMRLGDTATATSTAFQLIYSVTSALAGGSSPQTNPDLSLGKFASTTQWAGGVKNDLFDTGLISPDLPASDYRCIFINNTLSGTMYDVIAYVGAQSAGGADIYLGADPTTQSPINSGSSQALTIANETTAPAGVTFFPAATRPTGIPLGDIPSLHCKAFWLRRTVATFLLDDDFTICVTALAAPRNLSYSGSGGLMLSGSGEDEEVEGISDGAISEDVIS